MSNTFNSTKFRSCVIALSVIIIHLTVGAYFAGGDFFHNIGTSVPKRPTSGHEPPVYMVSGDYFEQLYRYSLPKTNLSRGYSPYFSGYQYNLSPSEKPFTEGIIFFPFSAVNAVLATIFNDITSFNIMALLSFPLVGLAMYLLLMYFTGSYPAALLSSLILSLLPHRTSFLWCEMVFGVDLVWPPLILLFFEYCLRKTNVKNVVLFSICLFCYATSNIQACYHFLLFSIPFFLIRWIVLVEPFKRNIKQYALQSIFIVSAFLPLLSYALYMRLILTNSVIAKGQSYSDVINYSPLIENIFKISFINEKNIYLGWPLILLIILVSIQGIYCFIKSYRKTLTYNDWTIFLLSGFIFLISYAFCFGANLDKYIGIDIYRWYFDKFPSGNAVRTPGRLMNTAGFYFSIFWGMVRHLSLRISWFPILRISI
jgi:hypothetical protein